MTTEHLKAFADISGVRLAGIHSRTASRCAPLIEQYNLPIHAPSIGELYEKTKADLVVISVPELSVREVCVEAFRYPWTCLIEKPAGCDLADAAAILDAAVAGKRKAFVALNRRHYASTRAVVDGLAADEGRRLVHVYDQQDQAAALKAGQPERVVDNWMYANSIHVVDYFTFLGRGEVTSVDVVEPFTPGKPCFVVARLAYDSGDIGLYEALWGAPGPWAATVTTQKMRWELRPLEQASCQPYGTRKAEPVPINVWDTKFKAGLRAQAEEAVKAVRGESHLLPTLAEAMKSMHLVAVIYRHTKSSS